MPRNASNEATCARDIIRMHHKRPVESFGTMFHPCKKIPYLPSRDAPFTCEPSRRDTVHLHPRPRRPCESVARVKKIKILSNNDVPPNAANKNNCGTVKSRPTGTPHAAKVSRVSFQRSLESVKRRSVHTALAEAPSCCPPKFVIVSQVLSSATARATSLVAIFSHACLASSSTADGSDTSS